MSESTKATENSETLYANIKKFVEEHQDNDVIKKLEEEHYFDSNNRSDNSINKKARIIIKRYEQILKTDFMISKRLKKKDRLEYSLPDTMIKILYLELEYHICKHNDQTSATRSNILKIVCDNNWSKFLDRNWALFFMPFYKFLDKDFSKKHKQLVAFMLYFSQISSDKDKRKIGFEEDLAALFLSIYDNSKLPDISKYEEFIFTPKQ